MTTARRSSCILVDAAGKMRYKSLICCLPPPARRAVPRGAAGTVAEVTICKSGKGTMQSRVPCKAGAVS